MAISKFKGFIGKAQQGLDQTELRPFDPTHRAQDHVGVLTFCAQVEVKRLPIELISNGIGGNLIPVNGEQQQCRLSCQRHRCQTGT